MPTLTHPPIHEALRSLHAAAAENDPAVMSDVMSAAAFRMARSEADVTDLLADAYLPVDPSVGAVLHVLARLRPAGRIVEFGTSMGISTIYLAAALDEGEPPLVTTEQEPAKAAAARRNIADAGLAERVELREGDALQTLAGTVGPVGMVFLDGWKALYLPVLRLLEPTLVDGAIVVADDTTLLPELCAPFLEHVRSSPRYRCTEIGLDDGLEVCIHRRGPG